MTFDEYLAEEMRDPVYRRWHRFYAIVGFPRRLLLRMRLARRRK